jgi:hypothetical protein
MIMDMHYPSCQVLAAEGLHSAVGQVSGGIPTTMEKPFEICNAPE